MSKKRENGGHGQISRFYQTELLSSEECGVYISNIEIYKISQEMGYDITFATNEFILAELFKCASENDALDELGQNLLEIFNSRLNEYKGLALIYPKAKEPISSWIQKCEKTIQKIQASIDSQE